ncbi:MAG: prepilin-type N-terminal cleavage/methylation domain-containing protein [Methylotenera sp.]|uniref:type IV pilus modification PilV family protein n=1 Tax=Methylotenera sp. TaxID=2051956 RepID=UPI002488E63C|nr:prepilin-type N-terminal cleavage/methylation domain-containing protein [Methylotenera sp.]MDI1308766.1 prepilin-type N-terminal cleavage/methylation domain-containing protein [Methylotenera sp.]
MLNQKLLKLQMQTGMSLIEVMVTIVIVALGLLGLAGLQMKTRTIELESYQRTQAMVILNGMASQFQMNRQNAATYTSAGLIGGTVESCVGKAGAAYDLCEWGNALSGAAETSSGDNLGAMIGAKACVVQISAPVITGACAPGIYELTVTWQGMFKTIAPNNTCAANSYGDDALRRAISLRVATGATECI